VSSSQIGGTYPVSGVMSPVINWIAKFTGCWFENGDLPIENGDFIYWLLVWNHGIL
jgi:hypothetical protein